MVEEERPLHLAPLLCFGMQHATGHDKMHMGMVVDPPGVGMQHGGGGKFCRQVGVIATELSQGVDGRLE